MSAWLQRHAGSHGFQLAGTALVSGALVAGAILGAQALHRRTALEELKAPMSRQGDGRASEGSPTSPAPSETIASAREDARTAALAKRALQGDYDQGTRRTWEGVWSSNLADHVSVETELIAEQLTRTASFLTPEGLTAVRSSFVIVVGLGGVGSHCVTALVRSGVSRIRIIDFDQVTLSSLNRHAVATLADVGTPKVHCMRKRLEGVAPWVQMECLNELWRTEEAARLMGPFTDKSGAEQKPDFVVDAIDNIDSKVALLKWTAEAGLRVISAMGAGCKSDPTRVLVGDISTSLEDPLSRATRRRLRLAGVSAGIPVVYSTEKPGSGKAALLPLPEDEFHRGSVDELGVLPAFRARILPVLGTMPAVFGYVAANYVLVALAHYPFREHMGKGRDKLYETVLGQLQASEEKLVRSSGLDALGLKIPLTRDEVGFLMDDVFRGKSVVSGLATRLTLVRWRAPVGGYEPDERWEGQRCAKLRLSDLICTTKEEAVAHEREVLLSGAPRKSVVEVYGEDIVELVERRMREVAAMERYR